MGSMSWCFALETSLPWRCNGIIERQPDIGDGGGAWILDFSSSFADALREGISDARLPLEVAVHHEERRLLDHRDRPWTVIVKF
jgi:hypothetical protein